MARRKMRRKKSNLAQVLLILILTVFLVGIAVGIGYLYWQATVSNAPIDEVTLCPLDGPTSQTIALIDTTDPMPRITQAEVVSRLRDVTNSIEKGGLLQVRVLNEDPAKLQIIQSLCNPGSPEDINPLISNPERARKRWEERFSGPLETALDESLRGIEQNASPILSALQQIAAEQLSSDAQRSKKTKIIVVSDLIEHTAYYSHYREGTNYRDYENIAGTRFFSRLSGAEIEFWMISRDTRLDETALGTFWLKWTSKNGGVGHVERLMGQ